MGLNVKNLKIGTEISGSCATKGQQFQSPSEKSVKYVQNLKENNSKSVSSPPLPIPENLKNTTENGQ